MADTRSIRTLRTVLTILAMGVRQVRYLIWQCLYLLNTALFETLEQGTEI